jgi:large subunit ribosomal protein L3
MSQETKNNSGENPQNEKANAPAQSDSPKTENTVKEAPVTFRMILGQKLGMTQVFDEEGALKGVSVIKAGPCQVVNIRTSEKDGYRAVCLGFGEVKKERLSKPMRGQFEKMKVEPSRHLQEYRVESVDGFEIGQSVLVNERFKVGDYIDVQGYTKGKGFAGAMKRHGFAGLPASHGASDKERSPGSIASRRSLGRVIPGQRMAGRMGQEKMTVPKLEVVKIDAENHLIYLNGSVPGARGSLVSIYETTKPMKRKPAPQAKSSKKAKGKK